MKKNIRIFIVALKNAVAIRMAYRGDFFINLFVITIFEFIIPVVTVLIYSSGLSFPGWSLYEVLLIQSTFLMITGITYSLFMGMVSNVLFRVREGTFDLILIKPSSSLYLTIVTGLNMGIGYAGKIAGGIGLFVFSLIHLPSPGLYDWMLFTILVIVSMIVILSFMLIMAATVFVWVGNTRVYEVFDTISRFGLYPQSIYSKSFQIILSWVIPVSMIAFFPAAALAGKIETGLVISIFASILFFYVSLCIWKMLLRRYTSAGG